MSRPIELIEDTLRDGQLSLWATRMDTATMLGIGGAIDQAGFVRACVSSGAAFDTAIRFLREDPWARLRMVRDEMPGVPLEFLVRGRNVIGWQRYSDDVVDLVLAALARAGMRWQLVFDGLNDMRMIEHHIRSGHALGLAAAGVVVFTESPVHDDAYFVGKTRELAAAGCESICFYDGSGILAPERMRRLAPQLLAACGATSRLEVNVHDNTGLALDCYREAMLAGIDLYATGARGLAYGASLPSSADVIALARSLGRSVDVDGGRIEHIDRYFDWVCERERRPAPAKIAFDPASYAAYVAHQVPGGMISNFERQLAEVGMRERLPAILEEIVRIREEVGWPPMVTPYSQMIGVQATLNVIAGERYKTSPGELGPYLRGQYGAIPGKLDANVVDRVLANARERDPIDPTAVFAERQLDGYRKRFGALGDEALVLAIFYDERTLTEYRKQHRPFDPRSAPRSPLVALAADLLGRPRTRAVSIQVPADAALTFERVREISALGNAIERSAEFAFETDALAVRASYAPESA